jgi:hypothetical protein
VFRRQPYSEPIDPTTITNSTFRLVKADNKASVAATVSYDAVTGKATLDSNAELLANTTYEVTVNTGVKDLAGNAMAKLQTWQFTTGVSRDIVVAECRDASFAAARGRRHDTTLAPPRRPLPLWPTPLPTPAAPSAWSLHSSGLYRRVVCALSRRC